MTHILLTGAGFSRNWGGWVSDEAFEYLLGCPEITPSVRNALWSAWQNKRGFEHALAALRWGSTPENYNESVRVLEQMLESMFNSMNNGFKQIQFNPLHDGGRLGPQIDLIRNFLAGFEAIFTLNQDALLELQYQKNIREVSEARWSELEIPGVSPIITSAAGPYGPPGLFEPATSRWTLNGRGQPYIKLHGSANWRDGKSTILIMGGNKAADVQRHPLLQSYMNFFRSVLRRPGCKVVIIGYSFGDNHINEILGEGVDEGARLFIIDRNGTDALNGMFTPTNNPVPLHAKLSAAVDGGSRRSLHETFGHDHVERSKVMRFLNRLGPPAPLARN